MAPGHRIADKGKQAHKIPWSSDEAETVAAPFPYHLEHLLCCVDPRGTPVSGERRRLVVSPAAGISIRLERTEETQTKGTEWKIESLETNHTSSRRDVRRDELQYQQQQQQQSKVEMVAANE